MASSSAKSPTRARSRRAVTWILVAIGIVFVAFVVGRSFYVATYRCVVCMAFQGQQVCRTVEGPSEREARSGAVTNACAELASGVTDSMACERSQPVRVTCTAIGG